ncbi:MAG TPA: condensation domain-containing protein [Polyangiales bacterium]|nr:condensation domain-containing protein [Polyangiales bacterium]
MDDTPGRMLGMAELTAFWSDRAAPLHALAIARLEGPLTDSALRRALDAVQARQPLLRMRIEPFGQYDARFVPVHGRAIPLAIEQLPETQLEDVIEQELNDPLDWQRGPLGRCRLLRHGDGLQHVIVALSHVICDGRSFTLLMRDVLQAAAQTGPVSLPPVAMAEPVEALLPAALSWPRALGRVLPWLPRIGLQALRCGRPQKLPRDHEVPVEQRRSRAMLRVFDRNMTRQLRDRARTEGASMQGILMATQVQACSSGGQRSALLATAVDLRPHFQREVGEGLGYYVGCCQGIYRVHSDGDPWQLAREIGRDVERDKRHGLPAAIHMVDRKFVRRATRHGVDELARSVDGWSPYTTMVTNPGILPLERSYGALRLRALHFAPLASFVSDFVSAACTLDDQLHWTFVAVEPCLTRERARRIVDDAVERLCNAVGVAEARVQHGAVAVSS